MTPGTLTYHDAFTAAGYKRYPAVWTGHRTNSWLNLSDALYQRRMLDGDGDTAFFIDVYWYDRSKYRDLSDGWQVEVQFNTRDDDKDHPTFNVTLCLQDGQTVDEMEAWFWRVYRLMECRPCERREGQS